MPSARVPPERGWSDWYLPDEDDVVEGAEHGVSIRLLLSALGQLATERGWQRVFIAGDQFFAWIEDEPLVRISPDVYVLDEPPPRPFPGVWETWRAGQRSPRFAVEVVSDDWRKDYRDNPRKYAQLGCTELVIFDPDAALHPRSPRTALQLYRRRPDGTLYRVALGDGPIYCEQIDAWIVLVDDGGCLRARLARDASGAILVPTAEELARRVPALEAGLFLAERRAEAAERRITELERRLALSEARSEASERRMLDALAERDLAVAELATTRARLRDTEAKLAATETKLAATEAKLAATETKLAATEAKLVATETKLAATETKLAATEAKLVATEAKLAATETKLAATEAKLAATEAELATTRARLTASEARADRLEALLAQALRRIDNLEAELAALRRA